MFNIEKFAGQPTLGRHLSEETKKKIGKANSINRMTPEHFKKFREASIKLGCPMKGKNHSEDTKKRMSDSRKKYLQTLKNLGLSLPGPKIGSSWTKARRDAEIARKNR